MTDLAYMTIAEASRLIRARKLSPVELTDALLDRIAALDGIYHAYIAVTADAARTEAKAAEAEIAGGTWRGPMHGIPYAAKDIFDVAGLATTCHSKLRMDHRAAADATTIARLRAAGAILLGKLALHEFATGGPTRELPWPAAVNPWNLDLHPGGSSSGSAVAVATGLAPGSLGTDTGGSVRNPATCCGVIGMKPTYGLVSRAGVFPLSFSLDHVGPAHPHGRGQRDPAPRHRRPRSRRSGKRRSRAGRSPRWTSCRSEGPAHRRHRPFLHGGHGRRARAGRRHRRRRRRAAPARRRGTAGAALLACALCRLRPHHSSRRGLRGARARSAAAPRRLRRDHPEQAVAGRLHPRERLRQGSTVPPPALPRNSRR